MLQVTTTTGPEQGEMHDAGGAGVVGVVGAGVVGEAADELGKGGEAGGGDGPGTTAVGWRVQAMTTALGARRLLP
ncbi:hypothetical protein GUJ93_ZPchr0458g22432 [Zizania palustris]|uniref:Uncharacterized protein n=1 Tax=Zizania palustris TaxID=103762 RepID=A0A8J5RRL0_ZIZPA|nr:hypothetical protein GUJ93_ZPchr0458g22432 [Zizania palustris]